MALFLEKISSTTPSDKLKMNNFSGLQMRIKKVICFQKIRETGEAQHTPMASINIFIR